jgi:carboxypeptidase Taq
MSMNAAATPAYDALMAQCARMQRLEHLQAIATWDRATHMPPKGNEARGAAIAEVTALLHRMRTAPSFGQELERAEQEPLTQEQRADLRELRRRWDADTALPEALVEQGALAGARCEHAWRSRRPAHDWDGFLDDFRPVLANAREQAARLAERLGVSRYEALMAQYEPGLRCATVDRVFGEVRQWLPALVQEVVERQRTQALVEPLGPFALPAQRALCEHAMRLFGFDFEAGRLDVSAHPFCGGVPAISSACPGPGWRGRSGSRARWPSTRARAWPSRCSWAAIRASWRGWRRCCARPSARSRRSSRRTCSACSRA